jgi:hypothetical protein
MVTFHPGLFVQMGNHHLGRDAQPSGESPNRHMWLSLEVMGETFVETNRERSSLPCFIAERYSLHRRPSPTQNNTCGFFIAS